MVCGAPDASANEEGLPHYKVVTALQTWVAACADGDRFALASCLARCLKTLLQQQLKHGDEEQFILLGACIRECSSLIEQMTTNNSTKTQLVPAAEESDWIQGLEKRSQRGRTSTSSGSCQQPPAQPRATQQTGRRGNSIVFKWAPPPEDDHWSQLRWSQAPVYNFGDHCSQTVTMVLRNVVPPDTDDNLLVLGLSAQRDEWHGGDESEYDTVTFAVRRNEPGEWTAGIRTGMYHNWVGASADVVWGDDDEPRNFFFSLDSENCKLEARNPRGEIVCVIQCETPAELRGFQLYDKHGVFLGMYPSHGVPEESVDLQVQNKVDMSKFGDTAELTFFQSGEPCCEPKCVLPANTSLLQEMRERRFFWPEILLDQILQSFKTSSPSLATCEENTIDQVLHLLEQKQAEFQADSRLAQRHDPEHLLAGCLYTLESYAYRCLNQALRESACCDRDSMEHFQYLSALEGSGFGLFYENLLGFLRAATKLSEDSDLPPEIQESVSRRLSAGLPPFVLFRGVARLLPKEKQLKPGDIVRFPQCLSVSLFPAQAINFLSTIDGSRVGTVMVFESRGWLLSSMRGVSVYPEEGEYVYEPNSRFTVSDIVTDEERKHQLFHSVAENLNFVQVVVLREL
eukprot:GGOE01018108.1.p1 GENE.GGOE01018108.1~~GGOE01018108.1.p1  ORF type:complete len:627 (-),score=99.71 GGOE01018108.1:186-2066(-)